MLRRLLSLALALVACGAEDETSPAGGGGGTAQACPVGHVALRSGACIPVGIQGCADVFLGEDGLCAPSPDHCPPGTIPKFREGCVAVGISNCAPEFLEADGQCHALPEKCPPSAFPVPTQGCVAIDGDGCGSGIWGNIADIPGTIWVDASFSGARQNGTQLAPFNTIAAALAAVTAGSRIALAAGNYAEPITVDMPLEIVGRCPSMVTISGAQIAAYLDSPVTLLSDGAMGLVVRGVRLTGEGVGVLALGGAVELSGVHIDHATLVGVQVSYGTLTMERSLIAGTLPQPSTADFGYGVYAELGADVVLRESAVVGNHTIGLSVIDVGTTGTLEDSVIARTEPGADDLLYGYGAQAAFGASLSLASSALIHNRALALAAFDYGTTVTVRDSLLARTAPQASDLQHGYGAVARAGSLSLASSALVENHGAALIAIERGTSVTAQDCLLAKTQPRVSDLLAGYGAVADRGATMALGGTSVTESRAAAVLARDTGTSVTVQQALLARTAAQANDLFGGYAAQAHSGASLSLDASALVENRSAAVAALDSNTVAAVTGCFIARTLPNEKDGSEGIGVGAVSGATLTLGGSLVREAHGAGVLLSQAPTTATLSATLIDRLIVGKFHSYDANAMPVATYDGVADGLVVAFGANAGVSDLLVHNAPRSALVFHESSGQLRDVDAIAERFGLVLQGSPRPDWQHSSNRFTGGEQDVVADGTLPIPEAPPLPKE